MSKVNDYLEHMAKSRAKVLNKLQDVSDDSMSLPIKQLNSENARKRKKIQSQIEIVRLQVESLSQKIKQTHPKYYNLTKSVPLLIEDVRKLLRSDEALVIAKFIAASLIEFSLWLILSSISFLILFVSSRRNPDIVSFI